MVIDFQANKMKVEKEIEEIWEEYKTASDQFTGVILQENMKINNDAELDQKRLDQARAKCDKAWEKHQKALKKKYGKKRVERINAETEREIEDNKFLYEINV